MRSALAGAQRICALELLKLAAPAPQKQHVLDQDKLSKYGENHRILLYAIFPLLGLPSHTHQH